MEPTKLYRTILRSAWRTARSKPYLWALGFFAALLGNGGEPEFALSQFKKLSEGSLRFSDAIISTFGTGGANIINFSAKMFENSSHSAFAGLGLFLAIFAILWIVVSAQGALLAGSVSSGLINFGSARSFFARANRSFFSLLSILLLARAAAFFIFAVIGIPIWLLLLYFVDTATALFIVLFSFGIPVFIISSLISKYAICFHMIDKKKSGSSIISALSLFFDHWLVSIELALILFVFNLIAGAIIILFIVLCSVPFMIISRVLMDSHQSAAFGFALSGQIIVFSIMLVLGSVVSVFQYASWAELFLRISKEKHLSKIVRVIMGLKEKYGRLK